ncbi:MAG: immunity 50 family protein [Alphaproteobacteria bacterium]|nr:immunity 50 family protein [Alphaproteobacteria bacterium]
MSTVNIELLNAVPGGPELVAWFDGHAPRFHDAEVTSIAFDRAGPSCRLRVHGFKVTRAIKPDGPYVFEGHAVVAFRIDEVTGMQLDDFNHQNALMGLSIVRGPNEGFRVELDPAYGLSGFIEGRSLSIAIEPGIPPGSQYEAENDVR